MERNLKVPSWKEQLGALSQKMTVLLLFVPPLLEQYLLHLHPTHLTFYMLAPGHILTLDPVTAYQRGTEERALLLVSL